MTEGSETWEVDSSGKVIDICGTREVLFFNFAYKYTSTKSCECNLYGNEANLFMANLTEEKINLILGILKILQLLMMIF